jgi:hypothetical protein
VGEEEQMFQEIKRGQWAQFLRKFSADNHYRRINISYNDSGGRKETTFDNRPFLGLALEKKGRFINGIQFFAGRGDSEKIAEPVLAISDPDRIIVEKDENDQDRRVTIRTKDRREMIVNIGPRDEKQARHLIEKVAYSIYLKRGGQHGAHSDDWHKAEKKVKETEKMFA